MPRNGLLAAYLVLLFLVARPTFAAEQLVFDFTHHAPLLALMKALEADDKSVSQRFAFINEAPKFQLQRFAVEGESADDWIEAFEVLNTSPRKEPKTPAKWYENFRKHGDSSCASEWEVITENVDGLTFKRTSPACPPHAAQTALYRVLYGRDNVFTLIATRKESMPADTEAAYLKVLASAKFEIR